MRTSLKFVAGFAALVAPVGLGWAYTAGASVGDGGFGVSGLFGEGNIDQFSDDDGYLITREDYGGVVTMTVIDSDGVEVAIEDLPEDVAERVTFYESGWTPEVSPFNVDDGATCYVLADPEPGYGVVEDDGGQVRALTATDDGNGGTAVVAREWASGTLTEAQIDALQTEDIPISDTPGGTDIEPCDG